MHRKYKSNLKKRHFDAILTHSTNSHKNNQLQIPQQCTRSLTGLCIFILLSRKALCMSVHRQVTKSPFLILKNLKRLHHRQDHDTKQNQHWKLVKPAVKNVTAIVQVSLKLFDDFAAVEMVTNQYRH